MINKKDFDQLYDELLVKFYTEMINRKPSTKYSVIYPCVGKKFKETGLMICGQAINGYDKAYSWKISGIKTSDQREKIIQENKEYSKNEWPLVDMEEFSKKKPFFRITKRILVDHYKINEKKYQSYFTWTNLMKIGRTNGGNPDDSEFYAQIDICKQIFKYELDYLQPKNVILFSGKITDTVNWAYDFLHVLGLNPKDSSSGEIIEGTYKYKETTIITIIRPERLPKGITEDDVYTEIIKRLQ